MAGIRIEGWEWRKRRRWGGTVGARTERWKGGTKRWSKERGNNFYKTRKTLVSLKQTCF